MHPSCRAILCEKISFNLLSMRRDIFPVPGVGRIDIFKCPGCKLCKSIADPYGYSMVVLRWQK